MKPINKQIRAFRGFTIIELLTVMSIIIILISLLAPALTRVKRYATDVKQHAQFHSISVALDTYYAEYEEYPDSDETDDATPAQPYCGAMKLAEAMIGQDMMGFHPDSSFRQDGRDTVGNDLYTGPGVVMTPEELNENLRDRKTYLEVDRANAYTLDKIYNNSVLTASPFIPDPTTNIISDMVLCDSYNRVKHQVTGKRIGMPILYYKADSVNKDHYGPSDPLYDPDKNTYDSRDNQDLVDLQTDWMGAAEHHQMASEVGGWVSSAGTATSPQYFYDTTMNETIFQNTGVRRPYRENTYILRSAGFDGEYGTNDDIFNFDN